MSDPTKTFVMNIPLLPDKVARGLKNGLNRKATIDDTKLFLLLCKTWESKHEITERLRSILHLWISNCIPELPKPPTESTKTTDPTDTVDSAVVMQMLEESGLQVGEFISRTFNEDGSKVEQITGFQDMFTFCFKLCDRDRAEWEIIKWQYHMTPTDSVKHWVGLYRRLFIKIIIDAIASHLGWV